MATFRSVMNEVLGVLSEDLVADSITELDSDYHKLIAHFVNQIKDEVEDAHNWSALKTAITVVAGTGASDVTITGSNDRSRLVRIQQSVLGSPVAVVFDITDAANPILLQEIDEAERYFRSVRDNETTNAAPVYFSMDMSDNVPVMHVYPRPLGTRTYRLLMVVPQATVANNALDTNLKVPKRPVVVGALWYALMERGEELGINGLFTEERFRIALDDAISRDWAEQGGLDLVAM